MIAYVKRMEMILEDQIIIERESGIFEDSETLDELSLRQLQDDLPNYLRREAEDFDYADVAHG